MNDDDTDPEIRADFERWCTEHRHLGRDRLWPAFRAGWIAGFGTAVDRLAGHQDEGTDHAS